MALRGNANVQITNQTADIDFSPEGKQRRSIAIRTTGLKLDASDLFALVEAALSANEFNRDDPA